MAQRPRDELPYIEYPEKSGALVRIYADAWQSEDLTADSIVTEHAVEDGSIVSDHIRPEQLIANVRLFFSETPTRGDLDDKLKGSVESIALPVYVYPDLTPLLSPKGLGDAVSAGIGAVASAVGLGAPAGPTHYQALKFKSAPGRLRTVFAKLMQLRAESSLFTLGLSIARLKNVASTTIKIARTPDDGQDGAIDLTFRQLSFVTTKSAKAIPLPLEPRGQPKKDSVTVGAAEVPPGPKKTGLKSLSDKL
jgi:hypothetical protein